MPSRLQKLIHYIVSVVPPEQLGATKLAKILWFSDIQSYRVSGKTITALDRYEKRDQGPLHADFYSAITELKQGGFITERKQPTYAGVRNEFLSLTKPDMIEFNEIELALVHNVIDQLIKLTAKEVSDLSHCEPWESAFVGEKLPIAAASVKFAPVTDDDMAWAEGEFDAVRQTA